MAAKMLAPAALALGLVAPESLLGWLRHSLGAGYVVIFLFLTVNLVALVVINSLAVWRRHAVPPELIRALEIHIDAHRQQEAYHLARGDASLLGQVLAAGMIEISDGYAAASAAMQDALRLLSLKMKQRLGYLTLIAVLAVLLGLADTVLGMSDAFRDFATQDTATEPWQVFFGLGSALVATHLGLWIAVVAVISHHVLRNRMNLLITEVGILSERLLKRTCSADHGTNPTVAP
ncbi:MAG: MotA/TolQ/ExbB proton channel family protein [Thermoguttaceae bacterium]|jgi:biopolymer transport protein ExbB